LAAVTDLNRNTLVGSCVSHFTATGDGQLGLWLLSPAQPCPGRGSLSFSWSPETNRSWAGLQKVCRVTKAIGFLLCHAVRQSMVGPSLTM